MKTDPLLGALLLARSARVLEHAGGSVWRLPDMSSNAPAALETAATDESTDVNSRLRRAVTECHTVVPEGDGVYSVTSESGREYTATIGGECDCPDAEYNLADGELCKHALRVQVVARERCVPEAIDRDDVDPLLGSAVDESPIAIATDGGTTLDDYAATGQRPDVDDCECWEDAAMPCFHCWLAGYEDPNPEAPGEEE